MAAAITEVFTVTTVNSGGEGRVVVTLNNSTQPVSVNGTMSTFGTNNLSLNLPTEEAKTAGFYPGATFTLALTLKA